MPHVVLIGASGQVGHELERALAKKVALTCTSREGPGPIFDLDKPHAALDTLSALAPNWIINAAAYTQVDNAESEELIAMQANAAAPKLLAEHARRIGARFIHYSTDYVFDGMSASPYDELSNAAPLNAYGRTKLAGDKAIASVGGEFFILRVGWLYGLRRSNFLRTMAKLAKDRDELRVVADQHGTPTWCRDVANATVQLIEHVDGLGSTHSNLAGTYHVSSMESCSWYQFTQAIINQLQPSEVNEELSVLPITTQQYPTPARRPADTVLANDKFIRTFNHRIPSWRNSLQLCLEERHALAQWP